MEAPPKVVGCPRRSALGFFCNKNSSRGSTEYQILRNKKLQILFESWERKRTSSKWSGLISIYPYLVTEIVEVLGI